MTEIAIRVQNLSKCYQIYEAPSDRFKQFVMHRLQRLAAQSPKQYFREFWALSGVLLWGKSPNWQDLEIAINVSLLVACLNLLFSKK